MAGLLDTPSGNRIRIAFFGLRNAGKSTLVNAFCAQPIAIVSDTPGTTTDPVSKAMEILPLGPCLVTDTAGLDDLGPLGEMRVKKSLAVLATTDIAVWVCGEEIRNREPGTGNEKQLFLTECQKRGVTVFEYHRGEDVEELKRKIASVKLADEMPGLLDGLLTPATRVICVCPIDESAPKGRLILPQVQVIRACLDSHVPCTVVQPSELRAALVAESPAASEMVGRSVPRPPILVITDSQAFKEVRAILSSLTPQSPTSNPQSPSPATPIPCSLFPIPYKLTSFSILFARQKGDLKAYAEGIAAISRLADGDTVLIAEGCTHHRQCNDIGSVKIPKVLGKLSGRRLNFVFASGNDFSLAQSPALIVHCGGCMLTRREVLRRIGLARDANIPIVNYGMLFAAASGITDYLI